MKRSFFFIFILIPVWLFSQVQPNWESIKERGYPQWFGDAKLGIFIHWGLYSVPSYSGPEQYGEWYYRGLMVHDTGRVEFMKKTYGEDFKYEDFDQLFKAELFDPDEWAQLFKDAGAKYVLLVTKHHDGYCLWDSPQKPDFNSVVGGPKRNIVEELTQSVRAQGLKMGFYYSLPEWRNPLHTWYVDSPDSIGNYVENYMIPQFKELIGRYKPSVLFTDGEWLNTAEQWHAKELIAWYYNTVGPEAIVNDRWGSGADYGYKTPEYSSGITDTTRPWAECRGLGRSFGLNRNEPLSNYLTSEELIQHFAKLVAAGGGMTLNVGPAADGQIPLLQQERLLDLGNWLKVNGEAIYGSRPYTHFYETKGVELIRIDPQINFNWVRNAPDKALTYDHFQIRWEGKLLAPVSGEYIFEAKADEFMTLWIDGKKIFSNWVSAENSDSNAQEAADAQALKGTIRLEKGKQYNIKIEYEEKTHEARATLYWSYPNQEKQVIPGQYFQTPESAGSQPGLLGVYTCEKPYIAYTTQPGKLYAINLEFPDNQLVLPVEKPKGNAKVRFLDLKEMELPWKYVNNQLIIDTSGIPFSAIQSKGAWVFEIEI